jgi:hypothetical protein
MGISDGMQSIAEFRVVGLGGSRGIGFNRLQFATEIEIQATPGRQVLVSSPVCFACAGPSTDNLRPLGRTSIETSWYTQTSDHARREGLSFFADLSSEQLEALERARDGRSLIFRLDIHALVQSSARGVQRGFLQITYEANLSAWSKVLKDLGHMEHLVLAIELPLKGVPEKLRSAVQEIRTAYDDLIAGRYDSVIARVRILMDAIDSVLAAEQTRSALIQAFANRDSREEMSKSQRADLVRTALRHYTHLAHHVDAQGSPGTFNRHDAMFVLAGAASALWNVIGKILMSPPAQDSPGSG